MPHPIKVLIPNAWGKLEEKKGIPKDAPRSNPKGDGFKGNRWLAALAGLESHKGIQHAPKPFEPNRRFKDGKTDTVFVLGREWSMYIAWLASQKIALVIHAIFIREATF